MQRKKLVRRLSQEMLIEGAPGVGKTTLAWHLVSEVGEGRDVSAVASSSVCFSFVTDEFDKHRH